MSDERRQLLAEGEKFADFKSRTIDNSFGSWFAFDEHGPDSPPPSEIKTSIAVWVGLYPTVVLLSLLLWPLKMPLWLNLLVGNLFSSFAMTFVTMPYYVNPAAETLASTSSQRAEVTHQLARHRHFRCRPCLLDCSVLPRHQGLLASALTRY